jgi:hypothetical protein
MVLAFVALLMLVVITLGPGFFLGDYSRCFQLRGMVAKLAALGKGFLPNK